MSNAFSYQVYAFELRFPALTFPLATPVEIPCAHPRLRTPHSPTTWCRHFCSRTNPHWLSTLMFFFAISVKQCSSVVAWLHNLCDVACWLRTYILTTSCGLFLLTLFLVSGMFRARTVLCCRICFRFCIIRQESDKNALCHSYYLLRNPCANKYNNMHSEK